MWTERERRYGHIGDEIERKQGQMRDVQTERKEALFIIFVTRRVSFQALGSERERAQGQEASERWRGTAKERVREEAGRLPVDMRGL